MKQKLGGIISIIFVLLILILGINIFKVPARSYLGDKASIIYANENLSKKDLTEFEGLLSEMGLDVNDKRVEEIKNEINNIYVLTYSSIFKTSKDYLIVADLKNWYYMFFVNHEEYFDKVENYYILKEEWITALKKYGLKYDNIYMVPHRGNILISTNKKLLFSNLENDESYSERIERGLKRGEKSNLGVFIFNLNKDSIYNIKNLSITLDYEKQTLKNEIYMELAQKNEGLNVAYNDRELAKYIENNRLYLYNTDFYNLFITLSAALKLDGQYMFLINFMSLHSGIEISKLLEDIDKEIIYDVSTRQGIVKLKNEENIKDLVSSLENDMLGIETPLKLENKKLYIGKPLVEGESKDKVKLESNQSFYFNYLEDGKNIKIQSYMKPEGVKIDLEMNKEMLKTVKEKLEKERGKK